MQQNPQPEQQKDQAGVAPGAAETAPAAAGQSAAAPPDGAPAPAWSLEDREVMRQRAHATYRRRFG